MSDFFSRLAFAWCRPWLLLILPLASRFVMAKERSLKEYVRVPFFAGLINELQLNNQPAHGGKLSTGCSGWYGRCWSAPSPARNCLPAAAY